MESSLVGEITIHPVPVINKPQWVKTLMSSRLHSYLLHYREKYVYDTNKYTQYTLTTEIFNAVEVYYTSNSKQASNSTLKFQCLLVYWLFSFRG
jgi:hypothetical protein